MESLLRQLAALPGVVGSLLCDAEGRLLAQAFPPFFEVSRLREAARILGDGSAGLETVCGPIAMIDLRYGEGRIVAAPVAGCWLLFLCAAAVNLRLLAISAAAVAPRIERLRAAPPPPPVGGALATQAELKRLLERALEGGEESPEVELGFVEVGRLHRMVQAIDAVIARRGLDRFRVRGEIALRAGFALDFVEPDTLDEPAPVARLAAAASAVLGESV